MRGYLSATGADRLAAYDARTRAGALGFLIPTASPGQYYDEGASGRCASYDPFNKIHLEADVGSGAHNRCLSDAE